MALDFNHIHRVLLATSKQMLESLRVEPGYSGVIVPAKALEHIVDTLLKSVEILVLADFFLHSGRENIQEHRSQMSIG